MALRALSMLALAGLVSACVAERDKGFGADEDISRLPLRTSSRADPSSEAITRAREHFRNEDYGLAEGYFRKAIEYNPNNGDAWMGLAASYDRLRRFDMAERAYKVIIKKVGYTTNVHNNLGYHHYLRGNLAKAREHFNAALAKDPGNPHVLNNLKLIDDS